MRTFDEVPSGTYLICPVCYWEDDPVQLANPTWVVGANHVSLLEARKNYAEFGASEKRFLPHVRQPTADERT
jgi:hypothetical protein